MQENFDVTDQQPLCSMKSGEKPHHHASDDGTASTWCPAGSAPPKSSDSCNPADLKSCVGITASCVTGLYCVM